MAKINIGLTSARDHLNFHVAPAHSRFQKVPNRENAIELAKALWDTAGWLWSDRHPGVNRQGQREVAKAFDDDLFCRCHDLKLFRDLADTAKHGGELHRPSVTVTGVSGSGGLGGIGQMFGPLGMAEPGPAESTLQIDYDGGKKSRDMKEALTTAYNFLMAETS